MQCRKQPKTRSEGKNKKTWEEAIGTGLVCSQQGAASAGASYATAQKVEASKVKARDSDNDIFSGAGAFDVNATCQKEHCMLGRTG